MTRVKICGITNLEDAILAVDAGCDALGFIFTESPRRINVKDASFIIKSIPPFVNCVGVFANQSVSFIEDVLRDCPLDTLQFHGEEETQTLLYFKPYKSIIKTIHVKDEIDNIEEVHKYKESDAFLLDTYLKGRPGGTGKTFNWDVARKFKDLKKYIILSGGLNVENVDEAIKYVKPYAVDVCSGVEETPGKKSKKLLKDFILKVKNI